LCTGEHRPAQPDNLIKWLIEIDRGEHPRHAQKHLILRKAIENFRGELIRSGIIKMKGEKETLNRKLAELVFEKVKY